MEHLPGLLPCPLASRPPLFIIILFSLLLATPSTMSKSFPSLPKHNSHLVSPVADRTTGTDATISTRVNVDYRTRASAEIVMLTCVLSNHSIIVPYYATERMITMKTVLSRCMKSRSTSLPITIVTTLATTQIATLVPPMLLSLTDAFFPCTPRQCNLNVPHQW